MYFILLYTNVQNIYTISMEVLLPNGEIMHAEGLYFLANAAKDIGDFFFSCVVILVLSGINAGLLTSLEFVTPGGIYLACTQPLYLLSFLTPPYPPIVQLSRVKKSSMNNKLESNLIPTVSDVTFGYMAPSSEDDGG